MVLDFEVGEIKVPIDLVKLAETIIAPESDFHQLGTVYQTKGGPLVHIDNGSNILAVAHLDTVISPPRFRGVFTTTPNRIFVTEITGKIQRVNLDKDFLPHPPKKMKATGKMKVKEPKRVHPFMSQDRHVTVVHASGLDDRLGVFIILHVLPAMNISVDVLLSTGEERGSSTALYVKDHVEKEYNWIVEFDRRGNDVVMYQYDNKETRELIKSYDMEVGRGSYTDICDMWELGVAGFNFGVGYERSHSPNSFAILDTTAKLIAGFYRMYQDNKDVKINGSSVVPFRRRLTPAYSHTRFGDCQYIPTFGKNLPTAGNTGDTAIKTTNKDYKPFYITFKCECGRYRKWIKRDDKWKCSCGENYWRGSSTGDIFVMVGKNYVWLLPILPTDISVSKCYICREDIYAKEGLSKTENGDVCNECHQRLYSTCTKCGMDFISNHIKGFDTCSWCESHDYFLDMKEGGDDDEGTEKTEHSGETQKQLPDPEPKRK